MGHWNSGRKGGVDTPEGEYGQRQVQGVERGAEEREGGGGGLLSAYWSAGVTCVLRDWRRPPKRDRKKAATPPLLLGDRLGLAPTGTGALAAENDLGVKTPPSWARVRFPRLPVVGGKGPQVGGLNAAPYLPLVEKRGSPACGRVTGELAMVPTSSSCFCRCCCDRAPLGVRAPAAEPRRESLGLLWSNRERAVFGLDSRRDPPAVAEGSLRAYSRDRRRARS